MSYEILKFKIPQEQALAKEAREGSEWKAAMWHMDNWLRTQIKHGDPNTKYEDPEQALLAAREHLRLTLNERGIELCD